MNAYIYKITNPLGKIYVGSTTNIKDRIYRYKTNRVKSQIRIYRSIKKYGWDNHIFEIIHECSPEDRFYFENKYGIEYNVLSKKLGLNCALPKVDNKSLCISEETRNKIGLAHKGKKISDEQKKQISARSKEWHRNNEHPMLGKKPWNTGKVFLAGEKNPNYGKKWSEEWKLRNRELVKKTTPRGEKHLKSKIVIDILNGIFYVSAKEASDILGVNYSTLRTILNKNKSNRYNLFYA
jgi:group I intron endonuclease